MPKIYPLIEGQGEKDAVPNLITRILHAQECYDVFLGDVQKANGKGSFTREGGLEKFIERTEMFRDCDGILLLLDADEECPLERALDFSKRIEAMGHRKPIAIVLANRDFENWFLASMASLRGQAFSDGRPGLSSETPIPEKCEDERGAANYLSKHFPKGIIYKKTLDQIMFTRMMDLNLTRSRSRSFKRFQDAVIGLVESIRNQTGGVTPTLQDLNEKLVPEPVKAEKKKIRKKEGS